ncbi:MAG: type I-B CRISPR-associated endonuclease Cas1b [Conexivisphaerales archaeon]
MRDYYIFKSGRIRRSENTVEFESANGEKKSLPINDIYCVHLFGEIDLNTKLVVFMNQHGIPLHFYDYYGYYSGSFYPREKLLSGFLVVKQVEHYIDLQKRLKIAREFVSTAINNILANLDHYKKNGKDVGVFIDKIKSESANIESVSNVAELMGIEGRARGIYYSSFGSFLREGFEFEKRTRMPPQNMLNSLISFGNSLMYATVLTEIYHTQLTPTVSYLHEPGERRYSLALDISEVFKPLIVDRVIFNLINNRIIKEEHFAEELNFCYLNEQGRRIFLSEYQKKLNTTINNASLKRNVSYQRLIRIECFKLVKHLLGEKDYRGLRSK